MRRKSIRRDRYIGGRLLRGCGGRLFLALWCLSWGKRGILGLCMENYGMDAVPLSLQWQERRRRGGKEGLSAVRQEAPGREAGSGI